MSPFLKNSITLFHRIIKCIPKVFKNSLIVYVLHTSAFASHIIGGQLEMRYLSGNQYRFSARVYMDEVVIGNAMISQTFEMFVFRRRDNRQIDRLQLSFKNKIPLTFKNQQCSSGRQLKISEAEYSLDISLNNTLYDDPQGYYAVAERCCRNPSIENIKMPNETGQVFYLEFSPLIINGQRFINSSPVFSLPDGEYVCLNDPFVYGFGATDNDGDELRYSLVTPFAGNSTPDDPEFTRAGPNYIPVRWQTGFTTENSIQGNPPLGINQLNGSLSLNATQLGLFVFSILCEEYRNGTRIGSVRRDFQLLVIDCPTAQPPTPILMIDSIAINGTFSLCENKPIVIQATKNITWNYQWEKDGNKILGAVYDTLLVRQTGTYKLTVTLKNSCRKAPVIKMAIITSGTERRTKIKLDKPLCSGGVTTLSTTENNPEALHYSWYRNGQTIGTDTPQLNIISAGKYHVLIQADTGCGFRSDTINVTPIVLTKPKIEFGINGGMFCEGDSILLTVAPTAGIQYQWRLEGQQLSSFNKQAMYVKQAGVYQVSVVDSNRCISPQSDPQRVQKNTSLLITMDSLITTCINSPAFPLKAQPAGGIFSGTGVQNGILTPANAGIGTHTISYEITGDVACNTGRMSQTVKVLDKPNLELGDDLSISPGESVLLKGDLGNQYQYNWSPPQGLNNIAIGNPTASPLETTEYQLSVISPEGCTANDKIRVVITEQVFIPDIFTPNGDGINDRWSIKGIQTEAEITVWNSWGETIYISTQNNSAWDGRYNGKLVPSGIYPYSIQVPKLNHRYMGKVMVMY